MSDNWRDDIRMLLDAARTCTLATIGEHGAEASMAPFVIYQECILLHLSTLAGHTRNITRNPRIGLMICSVEQQEESVLALPRLTLQGSIVPVAEEAIAEARQAYLHRISDAGPLFEFSDFTLFQFDPDAINWVGGFGRARKLSAGQWREICNNRSL